jgi:CYTH domain-containing protein
VAEEIERKFLVDGSEWRTLGRGEVFRQGYLSTVKERTVRIRVVGEQAWITVKGLTVGATRSEFEYSIPLADAEQMLELCEQPIIEKTRYVVEMGGLRWEVDEFTGANRGLVVAEVELDDPDQSIELPDWIGTEVTDDPRYYNANLIDHPYSAW